MGFVTLTFAEHITDRSEASKRFNVLSTRVLRPLGLEYVTIPERQNNGRFHFHQPCAVGEDVRSGLDFAAYHRAKAAKAAGDWAEFRRQQSIYHRSANGHLHGIWRLFRSKRVTRYGFGRCETLPIVSNAEGMARYVGTYVTSAGVNRWACDKRMRTVRYALRQRVAGCRWSWADGHGGRWRRGMQVISQILLWDYEDYKKNCGKRWAWRLRKTITTLGKHYETALRYAAQVPEWADDKSRKAFLARLWLHLGGTAEWLLPEVGFGGGGPAPGGAIGPADELHGDDPF